MIKLRDTTPGVRMTAAEALTDEELIGSHYRDRYAAGQLDELTSKERARLVQYRADTFGYGPFVDEWATALSDQQASYDTSELESTLDRWQQLEDDLLLWQYTENQGRADDQFNSVTRVLISDQADIGHLRAQLTDRSTRRR